MDQLQLGLVLPSAQRRQLSLPFWHAAGIVHWGDLPIASRSSSRQHVACWRRHRRSAVYGLAWTGVIVAFGALANLLAAILGQPQL